MEELTPNEGGLLVNEGDVPLQYVAYMKLSGARPRSASLESKGREAWSRGARRPRQSWLANL